MERLYHEVRLLDILDKDCSMRLHRSLVLLVLLLGILVARHASAAAPAPPMGQVVVDFAPAVSEPGWFVSALEELVGREFSRFHQVQVAEKADARACPG